jgi:hypothetical protein
MRDERALMEKSYNYFRRWLLGFPGVRENVAGREMVCMREERCGMSPRRIWGDSKMSDFANYMKTTGKHGWPLVPSPHFPGEQTLACPKCGSTDLTLTVEYPFNGTGPGGRGRLGDYGARDKTICRGCGETARSMRSGSKG